MSVIAIRTKNAKALQDLFKRAESSLEPADLRVILLEGTKMFRVAILASMRALGIKRLTGNLEDSVKAWVSKDLTRASAYTKTVKGIAPHAHLIEFGHNIQRKKGGHIFGFVAGKPFFRNAIDGSKAAVRDHINTRIKALLTMAFNKPGSAPDDTGWIG